MNSGTSESSPREPSYFEFQAMFGATKHGGGVRATRELVELCYIDESKVAGCRLRRRNDSLRRGKVAWLQSGRCGYP